MIEVRLFAGLRQGRQKVYQYPCDGEYTVLDMMNRLSIDSKEVNILLVNGFHQKPDRLLVDGDVVSLFPAVGGG